MAAIELELDDRIALCEVNPLEDPEALTRLNPSSKVPVLETGECEAIFDSRVIVSYLASLVPHNEFYPNYDHGQLWSTMTVAAQCESIIDAAVAMRLEALRPAEQQSPAWQKRWSGQILRNLNALAPRLQANPRFSDFLEMSTVVALAYLDFRHPGLAWRDGRPELSGLLEKWEGRKSFDRTRFPAG